MSLFIPSSGGIQVGSSADLVAVKTAATSGQCIQVGPGSYSVDDTLAKAGVNWLTTPGVTISRDDDDGEALWDDGNSAMAVIVDGCADMTAANSSASEDGNISRAIFQRHASSNFTFRLRDMLAMHTVADDDGATAIEVNAGACYVTARKITATHSNSGTGTALWWNNGQMEIAANLIEATTYGLWSKCDATPTGEFIVKAGEIKAPTAIYASGTDSTAVCWVDSLIVRSTATSIAQYGGNRLYVRAQKLFGDITITGAGLFYVTADKISAVRNGTTNLPCLLHANTAADAYVNVTHWDAGAFTGETIKVTAGTVRIKGMTLTVGASTKGIELTGGTLILEDCYVNTVANSSTFPVTKSGGTLKCYGCTFVANGAKSPIDAGTAQTVSLMGCFSNNALDGDVTNDITGGLITDAQVS